MKAIIENAVIEPTMSHSPNTFYLALDYFNQILNAITTSNTREEFRQTMEDNINLEQMEKHYFKYGWGSSHFWVKQIVKGEVAQQVIFVEF